MDPELKKQLDEIQNMASGRLDAIDAQGKATAASVADLAGKVAQVQTDAGLISAKFLDHEKWVSNVQKALDKRVQGSGLFAQDAIKAAIPERYKGMVDAYARSGGRHYKIGSREIDPTRDPHTLAAMEVWLKNAMKLQIGRFASEHAKCAEENENIEKALQGGVTTKAAFAESTNSTGGYTVPQPVEAMVLRIAEDSGCVRALASKFPMTTEKHLIPTDAGGITVAAVAEAGAISESEPTLGQKTLQAKMIAVRGLASIQVLADSTIGILDYWLLRASEAYGLYEDAQALEGDGTDFTGLAAASAGTIVNEVSMGTDGANVAYQPLVTTLFKGVKRSTRRAGAAWIMHPTILSRLVQLKDSSGYPIFNRDDIGRILAITNPALNTGQEGTLLGYPVFTSDRISLTRTQGSASTASNIYFGPWADGIIIGDLLGLTFDVSEHVAFNNAQIAMRLLKRTAIIVGANLSMTRLVGVLNAAP